uniref:Uncharacterized protein n=1 Tax=Meloidogyne javanica TaxID=6303 RepID=A0A915LM20_MELJA
MEGIQVSPRDVQILAAPGIEITSNNSQCYRAGLAHGIARANTTTLIEVQRLPGPIFTDKIVVELVKTELQVNSTQEQ